MHHRRHRDAARGHGSAGQHGNAAHPGGRLSDAELRGGAARDPGSVVHATSPGRHPLASVIPCAAGTHLLSLNSFRSSCTWSLPVRAPVSHRPDALAEASACIPYLTATDPSSRTTTKHLAPNIVHTCTNIYVQCTQLLSLTQVRPPETDAAEGLEPLEPSPGGGRPRSAAGGGLRFTDKDEHMYFWFPLLAGLSELTFDPRADIRCCPGAAGAVCVAWCSRHGLHLVGSQRYDVRDDAAPFRSRAAAEGSQKSLLTAVYVVHICRYSALEVLFDTLTYHGSAFTPEFWTRIFDSVLLSIFDHVRAEVSLL